MRRTTRCSNSENRTLSRRRPHVCQKSCWLLRIQILTGARSIEPMPERRHRPSLTWAMMLSIVRTVLSWQHLMDVSETVVLAYLSPKLKAACQTLSTLKEAGLVEWCSYVFWDTGNSMQGYQRT